MKTLEKINLLKTQISKSIIGQDEIAQNVNLTQHVFNMVGTEIKLTGFWDSCACSFAHPR
jgi:hypothetical protein